MQHRRFTFAVIWMLAALLAAPAQAQAQAQQAGTLISANPIPNAPAGMRAWKITYRTTSQEGRSLQATGVVAAPDVMPVPPQRGGHLQRQVIAWTHGAWGVAEKCGPSLAPNFLTISPALGEMVRRGYVVVAADYPGLASPTQHGFLVNRTNADVVVAPAVTGRYATCA